ncbi:MAG: hypothetical protein Kow0092_11650 [Deferrisomatales bacterium]
MGVDGSIELEALPCRACGGTMERDRLARFPWIVRLIGYLILLPSLLGVAMGLLFALTTCQAALEASRQAATDAPTAAALGAAAGQGLAAAVWIPSLVGGLLGWLLLLRRRVWRCTRCGHVIDRA